MSTTISETAEALMNARSFNRELSVSEIRSIVGQLDDRNRPDIVYTLELSIQFNEDLFATIVQTIKPRVGHEAMQIMIQAAVINANAGKHTGHACPIFLQVRKLAGLYLDKKNHVELCEECGKKCKNKNRTRDTRSFENRFN